MRNSQDWGKVRTVTVWKTEKPKTVKTGWNSQKLKKTERSETEQYAKFKSRTARKVRKCDCREKSEEVQSTVESQKQNS